MKGAPTPTDYTPEFVPRLLVRLGALLGETWIEIAARDERGRRARPPNSVRHPLCVLVDRAPLAAENIARAEFPGHIPDLLALTTVVETLTGIREDKAFPEIISQLERPEGFRHNMVVLGMVDLLRRYTPYDVQLYPSTDEGSRVVDFDFGDNPERRLHVEAKGPAEFDGPVRAVTEEEAAAGIEKVWRKATAGPTPQLRKDRPGVLLTGGVTLQSGSLPVIRAAAEACLREHGERHPEIHAIAVVTYVAVSYVDAARQTPEGPRHLVHGFGRTQFEWAMNPFYRGPIRIILTPAT